MVFAVEVKDPLAGFGTFALGQTWKYTVPHSCPTDKARE